MDGDSMHGVDCCENCCKKLFWEVMSWWALKNKEMELVCSRVGQMLMEKAEESTWWVINTIVKKMLQKIEVELIGDKTVAKKWKTWRDQADGSQNLLWKIGGKGRIFAVYMENSLLKFKITNR